MLRKLPAFLLLSVVCVWLQASTASAQIPVATRVDLYFDSVSQVAGCGGGVETFLITDAAGCPGTPGTGFWITNVRVKSNTTITNVPRAQVTHLTTAALCAPNAAPCLKITDLPVSPGTITVSFVTNAGVEGGPSNGVPFNPTPAAAAAPTGLRVVPR